MFGNEVISFDLDGTLTDSNFVESVWLEGIPRLYSIKKRISFEDARKAVKREYDNVGNKEIKWYDLNHWIKKFSLNICWQDLFSLFEDRIKIYPEVSKVLKELNQKGIRLIIISNASTEFLEFQLAHTNIKSYFEAVFSATSDFGLVKKTVNLYRKVCNILEIFPNEMIHVGDDIKFDFHVPRRLGILAFHLDRAGTYEGEHIIHNLEEFIKNLEKL